MPNSVSIPFSRKKVHEAKGFDEIDSLQHEKAAAQNARLLFVLQHRKRYGLHAMHGRRFFRRPSFGFNTASGMDCMQSERRTGTGRSRAVSIPQAVWIACNCSTTNQRRAGKGFNTASGMDCMQWESLRSGKRLRYVSIPQAVWIACNYKIFVFLLPSDEFQYRKRYGLHAISKPITISFTS